MRVLVDMDGVLTDCLGYWLQLINRYLGEDLKPEDITGWDIPSFCKTLSRQKSKAVYSFLRQPGFFRHLEPISGALDGMRALLQNHEVVIVTACKYGQLDKRAWLKDHLPEFNLLNLVFAHRKELIQGDALIDDGMHNLEAWGKENPDGLPICFAHPHNADFDGERAYCWQDVLFQVENQRIRLIEKAMSRQPR